MTSSVQTSLPPADLAPGSPAGAQVEGAAESAEEQVTTGPSIADLLALVDKLAARRPVAARLVAMTGDDNVGSKELAATLTADVALTTRVMKLANSAYFGLGGRVRTVSFAVTVVGFSAIRAMAATAAAGLDTDDLLPADFWPRSKAAAVASSELAPVFGVPAPDAFCLGLLHGLGQAILAQYDATGYTALLASDDVVTGGRAALLHAEVEAFGFCHTEVSAAALSAWSFPREFGDALQRLAPGASSATPWSRCLATALEAAVRLVNPDEPHRDVLRLSDGAVTEDRLTALLPRMAEVVTASDW